MSDTLLTRGDFDSDPTTIMDASGQELKALEERDAPKSNSESLEAGDEPKANVETLPTEPVSESESGLPPVDKGKDAWMFVLSAFLLETSIWGFANSYGVFQDWYSSSPESPFTGASPSAISAVGTVSLSLTSMAMMPLIPIIQKFKRYIKVILWSTVAVWTAALAVAGFTTQIWQLILLQGVVCGIGGAVLYLPVKLWLPEWFVKRRGLAAGIVYAGTGVGGLAFPLLLGVSLQNLGFRWTLRIWAFSMGGVAALAVWFLKPRIPVDVKKTSTREANAGRMDYSAFRDPLVYILNTTVLVQGLAYFPVSLYLPTFTSSMSFNNVDSQLVLTVLNIAMLIGQIVFGYLCDKIPYPYVMIISAGGSSLAAYLLWGFAYNIGMIFAFVVIFGMLGGAFNSAMQLAAADVAGENPATIGFVYSSFNVLAGASAIVGPVIAGALYTPGQGRLFADYGGAGFGKVTLFVGSMMALSTLFDICTAVISGLRRRRRRAATIST